MTTVADIHNSAYSSVIPLALMGVILSLVWKYANSKTSNPNRLPLPPGPKGLPIVGNILDIPTEFQWLTFQRFCEKYGDIVHLRILGKSIVILGSEEAITELVDKRSSKYSDRGQSIMAKLIGWDWNFALMPYGQRWRQRRRMFHQHFNQNAISKYHEVQLHEIRRFLRNLANTPEDYTRHLRFELGAIILKIAYGIQVSDGDSSFSEIADKGMKGFSEGLKLGSYLVEYLPLLRYVPPWFPGAGFRRQTVKWHADATALRTVPFVQAKEDFNNSATAVKSSIAGMQLEKISGMEGLDIVEAEEDIQSVLGVIYAGGADTTFSTLQWFLLAMILYPEVQKKAQAELDAVVGADRLPEIGDRHSLPYINAVAMECLRWKPVLPLSVIHATTDDDEYKGYFIPKGSLVIPSIWAITQDPSIYPDPHEFIPERFLKDGQLNPEVKNPNTAIFGFGRRICPGRHFAEETVFINIASVLHVFNIDTHLDAAGRPIAPKPQMTSGILTYPAPFQFNLKPRSSSAEALVWDGMGSASEANVSP